MRWKESLLGLGLLASFSCASSERLPSGQDAANSGYVSEEVKDFLRERRMGPWRRGENDLEANLDASVGSPEQDTDCSCLVEDFNYKSIDEYKKKVEVSLGPAAATTFDSLLQLYHTKLGVSFLSDTMSYLAENVARVATNSRKVDAFQETVRLLSLPSVQNVVALYEREEGDAWNAVVPLSQIAAYTKSTMAVIESSKCLEAYAGKPESEKLSSDFQGLAMDSFGYSLQIIRKARECQQQATPFVRERAGE